MGIILGLLLWIIAIVAVVLFAGQFWWFPENLSEHGPMLDAQFNRTALVVGIAFTLAQIALGWVIMRFGSSRKGAATYSHGSSKLEALWTGITAVVFVVLAILGQQVWAAMHFDKPPADSLRIEVTGQQFAWNFRYPGPDGVFGPTRLELVDETSNPLGVDISDPAGRDDFWLKNLTVPQDKPIHLILRSKDVIHSLFIPVMRFKQDAVPGMSINMHFKAVSKGEKGNYEIACAELCGLGHYNMKSTITILSQQEFEDWLSANAPKR